LGVEGIFSGANSQVLAQNGLNAWKDSTNANGGINGHPVELLFGDNQGSATVALSSVQKMVNQDHVLAIIDVDDNFESNWQSVVDKGGVPVIGGSPSPLFGMDPNFYSTGTTTVAQVWGELYAATVLKKPGLFIYYCAELPSCASAVAFFKSVAGPLGVSVVGSSKFSQSASTYTAPCLAGKGSGADSATVLSSSDISLRVIEACAAQGWTPPYVELAGIPNNNWLKTSAAVGSLTETAYVPWFDDSIPATKTMQSVFNKYAPGLTSNPEYSETATIGYISAVVFAAVAKRANLQPTSTGADLTAALDTVNNETFGGLTPPLTYTAGKGATVNCSFFVGIAENGPGKAKFTEPLGLKTVCQPAS
jgi:branched-chain amino acid transport system substrate-binding protein